MMGCSKEILVLKESYRLMVELKLAYASLIAGEK
jgi:hypothetical protein